MAGRERLVQPGAVVGRGGGDVELADPEVSRRHAMFRLVDGKPAVEDLSSRNGTFVNDRRADGLTVLGSGDRIRFGNTVWRVSLGAGSGTDRKNDRPPTALARGDPGRAARSDASARMANVATALCCLTRHQPPKAR